MKKLLCATALSSILAFSAFGASANDVRSHKDRTETAMIKASYSLPKKDGEEFRQTLHEADEENLDLKQQVAMGHADLYDMLTAPEFDRKAFIAKTQEVRKAQEQIHENRDEAFAAAVEQLPSDERVTLANAFDANPGMHKSVHHHHKQQASNTNSNSGLSSASPSSGNNDNDNTQ